MEENKTKAKIIAVAGKGGVGKTSLCSALSLIHISEPTRPY